MIREMERGEFLCWKLSCQMSRGAVPSVASGKSHGGRERCESRSRHRLHDQVGDLAGGYLEGRCNVRVQAQ